MKRVTISLPDQTDLKFRRLASQKFRFEKGWYSKAIIEAVECWMNKNEAYFFNEGISKVSRDIGKDIWNKTKMMGEIDSKNELIALDEFVDYFNTNYNHINKLNYEFFEDRFILFLKNQDIGVIDNYTEKFLCPLIMATRSGIEELTGDPYEIDLGNVSKIVLSKTLSSKEIEKPVKNALRSTIP